MGIYDIITNRIKKVQGQDWEDKPVTSIETSSTLAAEITLLSSLLVAVVMLRFFSNALMIIAVLLVIVIAFFAMPIMPKLKEEQNDSLNGMVFYTILALGIISVLFYWGSLNVWRIKKSYCQYFITIIRRYTISSHIRVWSDIKPRNKLYL